MTAASIYVSGRVLAVCFLFWGSPRFIRKPDKRYFHYYLCFRTQSMWQVLSECEVSVSYNNLPSLNMSSTGSKSDFLGAHLPRVGPQGWKAQCWTQFLYSMEITFIIMITLPVWGLLTQECQSWLYRVSALPTHIVASSFCPLLCKIFPASLQVILKNGISVSSSF